MNARLAAVLVLAGLGTAEPLASQSATSTATWRLAPGGQPAGRSGHAAAYDHARDRVVVFGGASSYGARLNDTWEWDGSRWSQIATASAPTARHGHSLVYDSVRDRIVLFGGRNRSLLRFNDTWEFDGSTWTLRRPAASPSGRFGHGAAFDAARGRTVIFSGTLDDVWEWDGTDWHLIAQGTPLPTRTATMAYDAARQRVVLYGGFRAAWSEPHADTWEWDGDTWTETSAPLRPTPLARLLFDDSNARTWAFFDGGERWEYRTSAPPSVAPFGAAAPVTTANRG